MSNLIRGISENGGVVFYGVDSTELVRRMEQIHKTSAVTIGGTGPSADGGLHDGGHAEK